jgi:CRP/FNR family transcriptional regulator, cyclic AMP receptor protein
MYDEMAYLLQGISGETCRKIMAAAGEESHAPGEFLFHHGEDACRFYILREGRIRLSMGETELLAFVASSPGDIVGWSSLVEEHGTYTASAECLVPSKVLKIEKSQLDEILRQDPAGGMLFFKHLAALVGRRLVKSYRATLSVHGEREPQPGG